MGLDLSRIEAFSRGMLEAEARRRGIRGTEFRTRGELVRLILRHQYGDQLNAGRDRIAQGRRALAQARELFGVAMGAAISALPEPLDVLMKLRGRLPGRAESRSEPTPMPVPMPIKVAVPDSASVTVSVPSPPASPIKRPNLVATTRTFVEEPIRTHSMARLLAAQGHRERALLIYEELLAQNSEDSGLSAEVARVRRGEPIEAPFLPEPPAFAARLVLPESAERLSCEGEPGAGFILRWHITPAGIERARAVLGCDGELSIRVIEIRPDPDKVVQSEVTEHGPVETDGEWRTPPLVGASRCFAAVGLRQGSRFVAIVHTHPGPHRAGDAQPVLPAASA